MYEGFYMSNYDDGSKPTSTPATTPEVAPTKVPWYQNPGFWAKTGAVGAALLPKWNRLKEAGEVASNYHQSIQLNNAQRKMMVNLASGVDPMSGISETDTMGLSPQQVTDLNKTGMTRQSELVREEREGRLAENTLATGEAYRENVAAVTNKINEELQIKKQKQEQKDFTIKMWEADPTKLPKFIPQDAIGMLKGMDADNFADTVQKLLVQYQKDPKVEIYADKEEGKLSAYDKNTGMYKWSVPIGKSREKTPENQIGFIRQHESMAVKDYYPHLKQDYINTHTSDPDAAMKFDRLWATIDTTGQKTGQELLYSSASPELKQKIRARIDEYNRKGSLGYGELAPVPGIDAKEKTDIPEGKKNKSPEKIGGFLEQNEAKIVRQLTGKPAGWKRINGVVFYWDGNGGISAAAKGGK